MLCYSCVVDISEVELYLEYLANLHDEHKYLPLAKDNFKKKFCSKLMDKKYYMVYIQQFYLVHVLVLKKINRCIKFEQKPFMKQYIDLNTQKLAEINVISTG